MLTKTCAVMGIALAALFTLSAEAAEVSFIGLQSSNVTSWRSTNLAKDHDPDGDNAYGTSGYWIFNVERKSMPDFVSAATGPDTGTAPYGPVAWDDPTQPIGPNVADIAIGGKLDLNLPDGQEGVFVTITLLQTCGFRLEVLSGHRSGSGEIAESVRLAGDNTTAQVSLAGNPQISVFEVSGSTGDVVTLYGTTRTTGQGRNAIAGIAFDKLPPAGTVVLIK